MKTVSSKWNRVTAMLLVMALLVSGTSFGLMTSAEAGAMTSTNLYTLLAEQYFSGSAAGAGILNSGALKGNSNLTIQYPTAADNLLVFEDELLEADRYRSGISTFMWKPYSFTANGVTTLFDGEEYIDVLDAQPVKGVIEYRLMLTNISADLLQLPATLMSEAVSQKSMLDRLSDSTYLGYIDQLDKNTANLMLFYVRYGGDPLHTDAAKDAAIRTCFGTVIDDMRTNCYNGTSSSAKLKLYDLLVAYQQGGLAYYYQNHTAFLSEIDVFGGYLTELLREDASLGLTAEDKMTGLRNLVVQAANYAGKPSLAEYADRISELESKMATLRANLTAPNSQIDVASANLTTLTTVLETGASVPSFNEQPTLRASFEVTLCEHVFDDENDTTCNLCGLDTSQPTGGDSGGGSGSGSNTGDNSGAGAESGSDGGSDAGSSGGAGTQGTQTSVESAAAFTSAVANAKSGDVINITAAFSMNQNVVVSAAIEITGTALLNDTGYVLSLASTSASITADGDLHVASAVDGYVAVKNQTTYALAEVKAPIIGGNVAGSKVEVVSQTRYLFVDLDPTNGMTLSTLGGNIAYDQLSGTSLQFAVVGNNGSGLVKTGDQLVVTAFNADGCCVATITYVVIVMGDANCNGKVNTSDATVMKSIGFGVSYSLAVQLAADANCSGSAADPRVNSSDVTYIMNKYFKWTAGSYDSNLG